MLRRALRYEPDTGELYWLPRTPDMFEARGSHTVEHTCAKWNAHYAGERAFTHRMKNGEGHFQGRLFGEAYLAHRVVWALFYGYWPEHDIDHENRDKSDNRIANLRVGSPSLNSANRPKKPGCSSRFRGVCLTKNGRWMASITYAQKTKYLGVFIKEEDAAMAYDHAANALFGEYASLNFRGEILLRDGNLIPPKVHYAKEKA